MDEIDVPYLIPSRKRAEQRKATSLRLDPEWKTVIESFAKKESNRLGVRVSIAAITMAATLNQHPELREKFEKLKEKRNGTINRTTGKQSN